MTFSLEENNERECSCTSELLSKHLELVLLVFSLFLLRITFVICV